MSSTASPTTPNTIAFSSPENAGPSSSKSNSSNARRTGLPACPSEIILFFPAALSGLAFLNQVLRLASKCVLCAYLCASASLRGIGFLYGAGFAGLGRARDLTLPPLTQSGTSPWPPLPPPCTHSARRLPWCPASRCESNPQPDTSWESTTPFQAVNSPSPAPPKKLRV